MLLRLSYIISEYLWLFGVATLACVAYYGLRKRQRHYEEAISKLKSSVQNNLHEPLSLHPEIDPSLCGGCASCVAVCPEGDILQMINHKAVLVEPNKCLGHGECEAVCPYKAIHLVFGTKTRGMDLPRVSSDYETNLVGLYIAGELGGMGLIRNAVRQGGLAAEHAFKTLNTKVKTDFDVVIVGAGPAGLSAALTCHKLKARYIVIEQNKFGGTISNFPRQKVVATRPVVFPLLGEVKFPRNRVTKEQLLALWHSTRVKMKLTIKEKVKFTGLIKKDDHFEVETSKGIIRTQKLILATGVRGTPRKLQIPGEDDSKVTYNLIDPQQYQGKRIVVVGGGNTAVETAYMLANPAFKNSVHLLVRSAQFTGCSEENRLNISDYQKKGRVKIEYKTSVTEITPASITVLKDGQEHTLPNDYVFVCAGAELPFEFLRTLGVMIEKKFGSPMQKGARK